jgi:hypothetical protein
MRSTNPHNRSTCRRVFDGRGDRKNDRKTQSDRKRGKDKTGGHHLLPTRSPELY